MEMERNLLEAKLFGHVYHMCVCVCVQRDVYPFCNVVLQFYFPDHLL